MGNSINDIIADHEQLVHDILNSKWKIGTSDRGMGRATFAVIADLKKEEQTVILTTDSTKIAKHVTSLHNASLGLV